MEPISETVFKAILAQAGVNQAEFARFADVTARQVNNWCQGRAIVPRWAALLALALREFSTEALTIMLEELSGMPGNQDYFHRYEGSTNLLCEPGQLPDGAQTEMDEKIVRRSP